MMEFYKNQIQSLGNELRDVQTQMMNCGTVEEMTALKNKAALISDKLEVAKTQQEAAMKAAAPAAAAAKEEKSLNDIISSREYARAFADSIRTGARPGRDMDAANHKILYDALTIAGGTPAGTDGGFLVPQDVVTMINEKRRAIDPMANYFGYETVNSNSGWRVVDTAPTAGFVAMSAEYTAVDHSSQPAFGKIAFSLSTYGLIIPVSAELAADETANLFQYLAGYFAKKQVLTENALLTALLPSTGTSITSDVLKGLKKAINVTLDPAIAANASWIMNQTAFQAIDELKDSTNRPMLQPDATQASNYTLLGKPVHIISDALMPSPVAGGDKIYVGDWSQYATLFARNPLEIASTDIGGSAFTNNAVEVRGIARLDARVFDSAAGCLLTL